MIFLFAAMQSLDTISNATFGSFCAICADSDQLCKEDDRVIVEYDRMMYPGVVIAVVGSDAEVSVLGRAGGAVKFWKWPAKE